VIKLEFSGKANLWPRFESESFQNFLQNINTPRGDITFKEILGTERQSDIARVNRNNDTRTPLLYALGKFRGNLLSVKLVENAFRDNLKRTTKLGNLWTAISYSITLIFFASIILLSGGASPTLNIQSIISIFGAWLIFELAFARGIFSSFKYGQIEARLGIHLRVIVVGMFSTIWMEFLALIVILNGWSIVKYSKLINFESFVGLFLCLLSLLLLGYPYAYFISRLSSTNMDMRFVVPVVFRFIVFSTPLFYTFHENYPTLNRILEYSPLNFSFNLLHKWNNLSLDNFISFLAFTLVSYFLLFYKSNLQNRSIWIESYEKY
jgi:ABC-type polysaccharide/polyol phosphate export permease